MACRHVILFCLAAMGLSNARVMPVAGQCHSEWGYDNFKGTELNEFMRKTTEMSNFNDIATLLPKTKSQLSLFKINCYPDLRLQFRQRHKDMVEFRLNVSGVENAAGCSVGKFPQFVRDGDEALSACLEVKVLTNRETTYTHQVPGISDGPHGRDRYMLLQLANLLNGLYLDALRLGKSVLSPTVGLEIQDLAGAVDVRLRLSLVQGRCATTSRESPDKVISTSFAADKTGDRFYRLSGPPKVVCKVTKNRSNGRLDVHVRCHVSRMFGHEIINAYRLNGTQLKKDNRTILRGVISNTTSATMSATTAPEGCTMDCVRPSHTWFGDVHLGVSLSCDSDRHINICEQEFFELTARNTHGTTVRHSIREIPRDHVKCLEALKE